MSFKIFFGYRTVNLFSLSSYLQQLESDNLVRLSYVHLHLFYLEDDVPLILCKQRSEQSTSLQSLWGSSFDDCAQYNLINSIISLQWFPVSFRLCVLCQPLQPLLSTSCLPWCSQQTHTAQDFLHSCNFLKCKESWFFCSEFYIISLHKYKWLEEKR